MRFSVIFLVCIPGIVGTTSSYSIPDGISCEGFNVQGAWVDMAIVVELSEGTHDNWNSITEIITSFASSFNISNTTSLSHTSRVAIIGYGADYTKVIHGFSDTQSYSNINNSLVNLQWGDVEGYPSIASGLQRAKLHLDENKSFRVPSIVLIALTYDDGGNNNPMDTVVELKASGYKLITITLHLPYSGSTPEISLLASPGLNFTSYPSQQPLLISQLQWGISQVNCRCPSRWSQLVVGPENDSTTYAECFRYFWNPTIQERSKCASSLVTVYTPGRLNFVYNLVQSAFIPSDQINIGLRRTFPNGAWYWQDINGGLAYDGFGFPNFTAPPSSDDLYGFLLSVSSSSTWLLLSEPVQLDRPFVCQMRACGVDNLCDLSVAP